MKCNFFVAMELGQIGVLLEIFGEGRFVLLDYGHLLGELRTHGDVAIEIGAYFSPYDVLDLVG